MKKLFVCCLFFNFIVSDSLLAQVFPNIQLTQIVGGISRPVFVTHAGDGSGRMFVIERDGVIKVIKNGAVTGTFLDIDARVGSVDSNSNEQGLLGLAFPPDYINSQRFYVYYTNNSGNTVVSRFRVTGNNPDVANPSSEQILLTQVQDFSNHNGGMLAFGPLDHYLYIGLGDGGNGNDPLNRAQQRTTFLGKLLRIDVESVINAGYQVPANNPFVDTPGTLNEIWALGLRNPWRFSFDRMTGDLYIGDVGQNESEEVDFAPAASTGGENYGWKIMEGYDCRPGGGSNCDRNGLTQPIHTYNNHLVGRSITGGYVHRGSPEWTRMHGCYFYADYAAGKLWALKRNPQGAWQNHQFFDDNNDYSSFGEDELGNVYICRYNTIGSIHRIDDVTVYPDLDNDDLPDEWETFYELNANSSADAGIDSDGDGMVNSNEFLAGTAPNDADSVFALATPISVVSNNTVNLQWPSAPGKTYTLYSVDLDTPTPTRTVIAPNLPATPPTNTYTEQVDGATRRIYQVEVIDP